MGLNMQYTTERTFGWITDVLYKARFRIIGDMDVDSSLGTAFTVTYSNGTKEIKLKCLLTGFQNQLPKYMIEMEKEDQAIANLLELSEYEELV